MERQVFPSENMWGIPDLDGGMLADVLPGPVNPLLLFRSVRMSAATAEGSIVAFYLADYRFSGCWAFPSRVSSVLKASRIRAAIEPDFSLWADAPLAQQLDAVYRSRWVARYWQSLGIEIVPSLNWADERSHAFAWLGIPLHPPVAAIECRTCGIYRAAFNDGLAAACEAVQPRTLLIYGERNDWVDVPDGVEAVWVEPTTNQRFAALKKDRERRKAAP